MFPVGVLTKSDVRKIGEDNEFHQILKRKESMGICFIEPQAFQNFLSRVSIIFQKFNFHFGILDIANVLNTQYVLDRPGKFVDVDTMEIVGDHLGIHHWTIGQRCLQNYYVVDNDGKNVVFVVS